MNNPLSARLLKKLGQYSTTTVASAIGTLNLRDPTEGYTGPDVRALMPDWGVRVGVAVTARFDSTTPGRETVPDRLADWVRLIHNAATAQGGAPLPVFAVVEGVGPRPRRTVMGPMIAAQIRLAGAVGLLTNGCVRDWRRLHELDLACWAAGLAPMHGRMRWVELNGTVVVDGMTVRPGDCIHADVNGAVVLPPEAVADVCEAARAIRQRDQAYYRNMDKPDALEQVLAARKKMGS